MLTPGQEQAPPLRLSTPVDAAFLDHAQRELETVLHARMSAAFVRRALAWRPRAMRHGTAFAGWRLLRVVGSRAWVVGVSLLSLAGLYFVLNAGPGAHLLGTRAVYARIVGDQRSVVWERTLAGWRHSGRHFTLLFKTETAETPHCVVLHTPSAAFEALLEARGIESCAPPTVS